MANPIHDDLEPWDRQLREPSKAFHGFVHYRDLGAGVRSIDKAWRDHRSRCQGSPAKGGQRAKNWQKWAAAWGWTQRCESWDREQDRLVREKVMRDQVDARARHARMAQAALQVLTLPSRATLEVLQDPQVLARYIEDARESSRGLDRLVGLVTSAAHAIPGLVEVERLALGLTTESIEITNKTERAIGHQIPANPESVALAIKLLDSMAGTGPGTEPQKE